MVIYSLGLRRPMFTEHSSPTESKSRFIEATVVFTVTFGLFFAFGYNEAFAYPIKQPTLTRQILLPLITALFPSALLLGTLYVTSYYQSRFVGWVVYAIGFFLLVGYYYPNFHNIIFFLSN